jgi:hypothetical protein
VPALALLRAIPFVNIPLAIHGTSKLAFAKETACRHEAGLPDSNQSCVN